MNENFAKESLGQYLKREREEKNISLEQVAYATRIGIKMLRALEENQHHILPSPTFVRGYLQAYAKYVRIDEQDALLRYQHFLASTPAGQKTALKSHYPYVKERYQEKYKMLLVIGGFFGLILVIGVVVAFRSKHHGKQRQANAQQIAAALNEKKATDIILAPLPNPINGINAALKSSQRDAMKQAEALAPIIPAPKIAEAPKTAETTKVEPAKPEAIKTETTKVIETAKVETAKIEAPKAPASTEAPKKIDADAAAMNAPPLGSKHILNLNTDIDVWFRFQADNGPVKEMTLRAGKSLTLAADQVIKIFSGNLPALKATFNGKQLTSLASSARPKSAVLPESESAKYPPPLFPTTNTAQPPRSSATNKSPQTSSDTQ